MELVERSVSLIVGCAGECAEPYMDTPRLAKRSPDLAVAQVKIAAIHPASWCSLRLRALMEYAG